MKNSSRLLYAGILATPVLVQLVFTTGPKVYAGSGQQGSSSTTSTAGQQLSAAFTGKILSTMPEAPLALRFFSTAVKTDSQGHIITGPTNDPVKNIVGPEAAGERGGLMRFTKMMFSASYIDGRPDPGTRRSQLTMRR